MEDLQNEIIVSISCLTYNHGPYIRQCLDGFMMQQCDFKFEVLINDDASTDGTQNIIKEYQERYPDIIKPIFQKENQYSKGVRGMNQKYNFNRAKGKYIAMCEGDDYWIDPLKLQKQVDFLEENSNIKFCYTDFSILHQKSGKIQNALFKTKPQQYRHPIDQIDFLKNMLYIAPCTWLFEKELIFKLVDSSNHSDGTFHLILELLKYTKLGFIPDCTTVYRDLEESASHSTSSFKQMKIREGLYRTQKKHLEKINDRTGMFKEVEECFYKDVVSIIFASSDRDEIKQLNQYIFENYNSDLYNEILLDESYEKYQKLRMSTSYNLGLKIITPLANLKSLFIK